MGLLVWGQSHSAAVSCKCFLRLGKGKVAPRMSAVVQFGCVDTQYPQFKGSRPFASLTCVLNQPRGGESEFSIMWIPLNLGQVALTAQPSPFVAELSLFSR